MRDPKPFEATPSRLARARREGDVPRPTELCAAFALSGALVALCSAAPTGAAAVAVALADATRGTWNAVPYAVLAFCACVPGLASTACALFVASATSGGLVLRPLRVDVARLSATAGLRRLASAKTATSAVRAVLGAAVAACALLPSARRAFVSAAMPMALQRLADAVIHAIVAMLVAGCAVGIGLGLADALLEYASWRRRLRMSADELKRDLKQNEGDPHLRQRRRAQHLALIRGSLSRLPDAAFVIANPSHLAVALEYRPPEVAVPRVLVRAVDAGARLVKARARALSIPIVEDVTLARTLLATTRVDEAIPRVCYLAVARIVAALAVDRKGA